MIESAFAAMRIACVLIVVMLVSAYPDIHRSPPHVTVDEGSGQRFSLRLERLSQLDDGMSKEEAEAVLKIDLGQWQSNSRDGETYYWQKSDSGGWTYIHFYDPPRGKGLYKVCLLYRGGDSGAKEER